MNQAQREKAAMKLCELQGINPYQTIPHEVNPVNGKGHTLIHSPVWQRALQEIEHMDALMKAVEYGRSFDI